MYLYVLESSEHEDKSTDASGEMPPSCPSETSTDAPKEETEPPISPPKPDENDELGPLPDNWEMAYTEKGEVYFIEWVSLSIFIFSNELELEIIIISII